MPELNSSDRFTLGFLFASLHTGASRVIWPSLLAAAERHNINLICFPGGRLQAADSFEIQRNAIFDLASINRLNGLITWSSSLGGVLGPAEIKAFHERYHSLPMVSLAQFMEGMPTVSVDSYLGMRALLSHLIHEHGFKRLAFIRGPEGHYYAQERYRAYLDALHSFDIPLAPQLITSPLPWEAGADAIALLLDERGLVPGKDFDAIVAVSDLMALWALKSLQARGYEVPTDIAVTGFNNSVEEKLATPPLTTVDLPFKEQGAKAMDVLLQQLNGESVPALITLPSELVVRQSCGCPSAAINLATALPSTNNNKMSLSEIHAGCLKEIKTTLHFDEQKTQHWVKPILSGFIQAIESSSDTFLSELNIALDDAMQENFDIILWQNALSILRVWCLRYFPSKDYTKLECLLSQARVVVEEAIQRSQSYHQWKQDREAANLQEINRALLTTFDVKHLTDVLAEQLPLLGIPSVYFVTYEKPTNAVVPDTANLLLAYTDHQRADIEPTGRSFSTELIIPEEFLPKNRRYSLVVEPLYFQNKSLGYVVFEIGPHNGDTYELLRNTLSSALQGALLFEEIQRARLQAEKADRIKTRLLANVSHEMRTPLNIIMGYTQNALQNPNKYGIDIPELLQNDMLQIHGNAEHQLRVINDLLDLSRAEIDELDLTLELIDPRQLLLDAFHSLADQSTSQEVKWKIDIPDRLPQIRADALRLRQIFLNILSNAKKYTQRGQITFGAEIVPPQIHFWVSDTGLGIDQKKQESIFEPFVTIEDNRRIAGGIGLGLSITRHLVALHGGSMKLESKLNEGSTFQIYLPLPVLDHNKPVIQDNLSEALLLISSCTEPAKEILDMCKRQSLEIFQLRTSEDLENALTTVKPVALAWDLLNAQPSDWTLVRRLRHYPNLVQAPFILYGQVEETQLGLTGFVVKSSDSQTLLDAIIAMNPSQNTGSILIVDDDEQIRNDHKAMVESGLPGYPIRLAENGEVAITLMEEETPALVLLDLVMPTMGGADVLDHMRSVEHLRQVPVIVMSNKVLSLDDVKRIENHTRVILQSKGIWSESETIAAMNCALFGSDTLPAHTSGLVKQALSYLQQNYTRAVSRWEIANAVGVSEDYLSRVFNRELNISPWDYLNRYRVLQSRNLLSNTNESIGVIAHQVGFKDQAYFSRVFRKLTGMAPQVYRESNGK
ncbi:MAG: substrate-binding domain-containing protein [Anaerolineaceae bacterium]|nr:substrate-binding domain-containing protein [Anaerolineaceae bacterium]